MTLTEYERRRQATSEVARRIPARLDDRMARSIEAEVRAAGLGSTTEGYEMACARLAECAPALSDLQRRTVAGTINRAAGGTR